MKNRVCELLGVRYPIISGGMVWCSGWRLAAGVSAAGGLGLIGAGSMRIDVLRTHIERCREALGEGGVFGVNLPLFSSDVEGIVGLLEELRVPVVVTSGGAPGLYTERLKAVGAVVMHVVASTKFAVKSEMAGVDAVICEGFEAGGHNGRDETTTMVLTPLVSRAVNIPVVAAGGIATGEQMVAAMALGAEGVQVGSRFALCAESSAHDGFKKRCVELEEGATKLTLKELSPVRLVNNDFYNRVQEAYGKGASIEELKELLGKGRARLGIFEGDLDEGEIEIGQVASMISGGETAAEIVEDIIKSAERCRQTIASLAL